MAQPQRRLQPQPPPLDAGAALTRLTTAVGERVLEERARSGLSAPQLQVLRLASHGVSMTLLAQSLGVPKSTATSVVDQLEALALATRSVDDDDRRRQLVLSTPIGTARLQQFDAALARRVDDLLSVLSEPRARRLRILLSSLPDASVPLPLAVPPLVRPR